MALGKLGRAGLRVRVVVERGKGLEGTAHQETNYD